MAEKIEVNKALTDEDIYKLLLPQIEALVEPDDPVISNLSNITAVLKDSFDKISWVGFYIRRDQKLYLGPFQGKVACTVIEIGSGVCGTAASSKEAIIVDDVEKFPGHIACDAGSKSEIVIPILSEGNVIGVFDLDSYDYSSFNEIDKKYLEEICKLITSKLNLVNYQLK